MIPLSQLRPGQRATIARVSGHGPIRRRYLEMGLVRGETIVAERIAPLGDPRSFLVKGYRLALRREDAAMVTVTHVRAEGEVA